MAFNLKLGKRLKCIEQLVLSDAKYDHIWDCCCDHGLLGAALLARKAAPTVHFVDIVPELVNNLTHKLERFFIESPILWQTHCLDVGKLPLNKYQGKHLVIIAGVGGDLMTSFVTKIKEQFPTLDIDFLLCPVHHQFTLREQLITLNFSLLNEILVEDNERFYEILWVSTKTDSKARISAAGNKIWLSETTEQQKTVKKYFAKTLSHYQRMKQGAELDKQIKIQNIIDKYLQAFPRE